MCVLQHAALQHAAVPINRQHTVWRSIDIYRKRIRRNGGGVKSGFAMLQIGKTNGAARGICCSAW